MRLAFRIALIAALVLQAASTIRMTIFDVRYHGARIAYGADRYEDALKGFLSARAVRPADPVVWSYIGDSADAVYNDAPANGWPKAREAELTDLEWAGYAGAVVRAPFDTTSWGGLAETALRHAAQEDAAHGVDFAVLDRRSRGIVDPWRGMALVAAKIAMQLKPSGYREQDVLTRAYTSAGQLDEARASMLRSARMMPAPSFHTWGSGELVVKSLYDAIIVSMREGVRQSPGFERHQLQRDIARFAFMQGDLETALQEFDAAILSAPDIEQAYLPLRGKAEVLEAMSRWDAAVAAWDAVIDTGFAAPVDRRQRGLCLHRAHREKEACRDLRESVREEPDNRDLRILASSVCETAGDDMAAERLLREGFVLPVDDLVLARGLLDLCLRSGKRSTVEGLLGNWTRDYPQNVEIQRWAVELASSRR
jgi:tetratricopeptide (TPR) repeat protein